MDSVTYQQPCQILIQHCYRFFSHSTALILVYIKSNEFTRIINMPTVPMQYIGDVAKNGNVKFNMDRVQTSQNASGALIGFPTGSFDEGGKRHHNKQIALTLRNILTFGAREQSFQDSQGKYQAAIAVQDEDTVAHLHNVLFEPLCETLSTPTVFRKVYLEQKFRLILSGLRRNATKTESGTDWPENSINTWSPGEVETFTVAARQYLKDNGLYVFSKSEDDGWFPKQNTSTLITSRKITQNSSGRDMNPIINVRIPLDTDGNPRINFKIRKNSSNELVSVPSNEIMEHFEPQRDQNDPSGRKYMSFVRRGDAILTVTTVTALASSGKTKINLDLSTFVMDEAEDKSAFGADISYTKVDPPTNPHHTDEDANVEDKNEPVSQETDVDEIDDPVSDNDDEGFEKNSEIDEVPCESQKRKQSAARETTTPVKKEKKDKKQRKK